MASLRDDCLFSAKADSFTVAHIRSTFKKLTLQLPYSSFNHLHLFHSGCAFHSRISFSVSLILFLKGNREDKGLSSHLQEAARRMSYSFSSNSSLLFSFYRTTFITIYRSSLLFSASIFLFGYSICDHIYRVWISALASQKRCSSCHAP